MLASAFSSSEFVPDTAVPPFTLFQVVPPLVVYHRMPWLVSVAVMAMPVTAPPLGSMTLARPLPRPTRSETSEPTVPTGLVVLVTGADVNAGDLLASRTGAVFGGVLRYRTVLPKPLPISMSRSPSPSMSTTAGAERITDDVRLKGLVPASVKLGDAVVPTFR